MGKQPEAGPREQDANEVEGEPKQDTKRKVIKKFPFKKAEKSNQDDLKDWKPTKIERKVVAVNSAPTQKIDIATEFLGSLSKPINKEAPKPQKGPLFFDEDEALKVRLKPQIDMKKLTPQQIQWDIEDQTFIRKQFVDVKKPIEKQMVEEGLDEPEEIVILRGSKEQTSTVRHIDLTKIIDKDWKEAEQRKSVRNQLWQGAEGLLDGRGNLAKLAKEAREKANEIDDELNKRTEQRRHMRNRYGW